MTEPDDRIAHGSRPRRRAVWLTVAAVLVVAVVIGLAAFQPWKVFTRSTVDEAAPVAIAAAAATTTAAAESAPSTAAATPGTSATLAVSTAPPPPAAPRVLTSGTFVDGEHPTAGTARVLQLPDGSRYLRLEAFSTSDGPDVQVWLTDQQAGGDDLGKYDDGRYLELGTLKGTDGNQNYVVPADADLHSLTSVVIWCDRFNVAFGSAAIDL